MPVRRLVCLAVAIAACTAGPTGSATAPASTAPASTAPSASPSAVLPTASEPPGPASRLDLPGGGPLGIDVQGTTAWIGLEASGELVAVDLAATEPIIAARFQVDPGGAYVDATPGAVLVGRYSDGDRQFLVVDPASGATSAIDTGPVAAVGAAADDGRQAWVLGTRGEVMVVDLIGLRVIGQTTIEIHDLEHLNGIVAAGSFWASSDTTAVRRLDIEADLPTVTAAIETGGGIPLAAADGLVWGARADELWAIDPATNAVTRRIPLSGLIEILDVDVGDGAAWIAARSPGRIGIVVAVDLASGAARVAGSASLPAGVAIVGERAWVTDYETDELLGFARPVG